MSGGFHAPPTDLTTGGYYGEVDHEHSFEAVLERLIDSGGNQEIMEEYGEYSVKERKFIKRVKNALDFVK